jgi:hypothetical protein
MADNRLVPYSVHLKREVYDKLKLAAGERKASSLVRDAITLLIEGDDEFNGGYNKGVRDAMSMINEDILATRISYDAESIAAHLCSKLDTMIVNQNTKEKKNGKAKK